MIQENVKLITEGTKGKIRRREAVKKKKPNVDSDKSKARQK